MLTHSPILLLLTLFTAGCQSRSDQSFIPDGSVQLELSAIDEDNPKVMLINRSSSTISINGLFDIGFAQSPISYEFEGFSKATKSSEIAMPVLIDAEKRRMNLFPGSAYGYVFSKDEFKSVHGLSSGSCYEVRAVYNPPDKTYSQVRFKSGFRHFCF